MKTLSQRVLEFLKKYAVGNTGYTCKGIADSMGISPIGLLRVLRELVKNREIQRLQQRNKPTLYTSLKESP